MKTTQKNLGLFYAGFLIPTLLAAIYFGFSAALLSAAGEYLPMNDIAARLEKTGGVFYSSLHSQAFWYKKAIYRRLHPEVAALGSSRVLQFRRETFTVPFANIGMMQSIDEDIEIAHDLFEEHAPKILILGVDYWWFNPDFETLKLKRAPETAPITLYEMTRPLAWIAKKKISLENIRTILFESSPDVGIAGITKKEGFDVYGSFHYAASLTGQVENQDIHFGETKRKFTSDSSPFTGSPHISAVQWKKFESLLAYLNSRHIRVILFMPPVAPTIADLMKTKGSKYAYIAELRRHLAAASARYQYPYFDFHDARTLGSSDCEFADGMHGGPVIYDRVLRQIAFQTPELIKQVNVPQIEAEIKTYHGNTSLMGAQEIDFLDIGCRRRLQK